MKKLIRGIPTFLVCIRLVLGPLIYWSGYNKVSPWWLLAGFVMAFLTDIFDGIIARRLQVSTPALRTADSWVDTWFYFWILASLWTTHFHSLEKFAAPLTILMTLQMTEWIYGRIKFGRLTGYHAYMAKLWGVGLFIAIPSVILFNYDGIVWWTVIILGWISSIENWLLTLTLSEWKTDVKSIFHVWRSRNYKY